MRKTKIIVTLGPAVDDVDRMRELIRAGADIARFNTAHGSIKDHLALYRDFLKASQLENKITATMLDIKGPEIRVSYLRKKLVKNGEEITIGEGEDIEFNHPEVYNVLKPHTQLLLHDGDIKIEIIKKNNDLSIGRVIQGGFLAPKIGANIPNEHIPIPYLQPRDLDFLKNMKNIDFIAASFVRNEYDIISLRKKLKELNIHAKIISKIENQEGVNNIDEILDVSDGIMVARGDLGTEIPLENLPQIQKLLLKKAFEHGKPTIIATQILESMIRKPHPTRAEVSDIANAILDGADALMLSGETAIGKYPVESVKVLAKVAEKADIMVEHNQLLELKGSISECVSNAAILLATEINADALLVLTRSGKSARLISRHRSPIPILAATYSDKVLRETCLYWGVRGFKTEEFKYADEAVKKAIEKAEKENLVNRGDLLVIAGGEPSAIPGTTNFVWVQIVGDILARGNGFGYEIVKGKGCRWPEMCDIVIVEELTDELRLKGNVKGLIIESEIFDARELHELAEEGLSIIAGTGEIKIPKKAVITIDPNRGIVWI